MSEAEKAFRTAFKADPRSAQAAYNLGVMLSKDQPKEALTWCRRAAELRPENPQYGYTYAFYLYHAGQLDEALKVLRAVRQRHPAHKDSLLLERQLLQEQKQRRAGSQGQ
jgi:Tfp pilus assembly protein PilF